MLHVNLLSRFPCHDSEINYLKILKKSRVTFLVSFIKIYFEQSLFKMYKTMSEKEGHFHIFITTTKWPRKIAFHLKISLIHESP